MDPVANRYYDDIFMRTDEKHTTMLENDHSMQGVGFDSVIDMMVQHIT